MKLLLLHALPLDERMWDAQREALWEHEVEAPNLYELGTPSLEMWAMTLLRRVVGEFVVVGASMGGYCGLALARLAPERVRALVLAGSRADADTPERKEARMATIGAVQRGGAEALWQKLEPTLLPEDADEELRARLRAIALEQPPEGLVNAIRAIRDRPDSTDVVGSLASPLLVVTGSGDPLVPPDDARALAESAPEGELVLLDGVGHLPSLQRPDEFNAKLLELVGRVE